MSVEWQNCWGSRGVKPCATLCVKADVSVLAKPLEVARALCVKADVCKVAKLLGITLHLALCHIVRKSGCRYIGNIIGDCSGALRKSGSRPMRDLLKSRPRFIGEIVWVGFGEL
jgi:hypothetical protein